MEFYGALLSVRVENLIFFWGCCGFNLFGIFWVKIKKMQNEKFWLYS